MRDDGRVGSRSSTHSPEKKEPEREYYSLSISNPDGRGVWALSDYGPSALYRQPICARCRLPIRFDSGIAASRGRAVHHPARVAVDKRSTNPHLIGEYGGLLRPAKKANPAGFPERLCGQR